MNKILVASKKLLVFAVIAGLLFSSTATAVTYNSNGAIAYSSSGGASVLVVYPAGIVANNMLVMIIGMKPSTANGGTVTTPSGWTLITSLTGAGSYNTTLGADTGNTNIYGFYKVAAGTETGSLSVTVGTNNISWGQMYRLSGTASPVWSVVGTTGSDTSVGSVYLDYGSNPGVTVGDYIIGGMVIPTDVNTPNQFSAEALNQPGVTFSTITEVGEPDSSTGNDIGGVTYRASVIAGTATYIPNFTATVGGTTTNVRGPGIFIRIRDTSTVPNSATSVSGSSGDAANTLNWTTSNSADFNTSDGSVVYRWASTSAGSEVPINGSTIVRGNTYGMATAACVISSSASTAINRIDGRWGSGYDCLDIPLTNNQPYTYKVFQKNVNGNYDNGVVIGTFKPNEPIILYYYSNANESSMNSVASCTNCGARIGGGAGFRQTITVYGTGFSSAPAGSRSTSANNIKIGTHQIADANITEWTPTQITFLTDSNVAGDTDADWGNVFGGANALTITVNSIVSSGLNFYVFPQITSITVPTAVANAAREYNAADTDGVITLNGTRFGTAATGGWVRILGCDSTTCSSPTGSAITNNWSNTAITVRVPAVIADNIYTGSVVMQQGAGTSNESHTYTADGFRILPRIASLSPTSGAQGMAIIINGNHLCRNYGNCLYGFDANNKVTFTSAVDASVFTSWTNNALETVVPSGTAGGPVFITADAYTSNGVSFSVLNLGPNDPTALNQFNDIGLTSALSLGSTSSSTSLYLTMILQSNLTGGTLYPQVEYQAVGTAFSCIDNNACVSATEGGGNNAPGPIDCSASTNNCAIAITPADGVYHWQARVHHNKGGKDYYSNWVSYGGNSESGTDFQVDKTGPVITFAGADTCATAVSSISTNSATIAWTLDKSGTGQLEYSKNFNLSSLIGTSINSSAFSHSFSLTNLDSNTTYYFRAKSVDAAGNATSRPSISPYCSFMTGGIVQPAKTTKFYIGSVEGTLGSYSYAETSTKFSVYVPENSVSVVSAFVELTGFSSGWGTNDVGVSVNGQATSTYSFASGNNSFKVLYPVNSPNLNFDPLTNDFKISTTLGVNIISAELVLTYSFAP